MAETINSFTENLNLQYDTAIKPETIVAFSEALDMVEKWMDTKYQFISKGIPMPQIRFGRHKINKEEDQPDIFLM